MDAKEVEVFVEEVEAANTRSGATRYVVRDRDGNEYTTFRPRIGKEAERFRGKPAKITFHEEDRNGFHNVYLDAIGPGSAREGAEAGADATDPDEVAWNTAVEAAPWLVGSSEPDEPVEPDELYERLEPFKRRVAEDIREGGEEREDPE
jgi:hypothetical protein